MDVTQPQRRSDSGLNGTIVMNQMSSNISTNQRPRAVLFEIEMGPIRVAFAGKKCKHTQDYITIFNLVLDFFYRSRLAFPYLWNYVCRACWRIRVVLYEYC